MYRQFIILLLIGVLTGSAMVAAQTRKAPKKPPQAKQRTGKKTADKQATTPAADATDEPLDQATRQVIEDLESELKVREANFKRLLEEERLEEKKQLYQAGIVPKSEIEKSEAKIAVAQAALNERKQLLHQAEGIVAEARAMAKLLTQPPPRPGSYTTTAALIRYAGPSQWTLENISKVSSFFVGSFGRQLPISAFGQTDVHNRMKFDHRNSVDVAIHPDSAEGQALMNYLRSQGIPFLAFRAAIPGAATGAHIHIGYPSHRLR